ncbi:MULTISPECIES: protein-disulfide reductase DsbD N-terminal domain-containing protein [Bacteroidota]|uniref:protein-disulfide reductase DsbD N-terminal domain-containing protein n=1 Tax=Bacteroidota TaxID=976 RepID=UPI001CBD955C|nr:MULTISPECIES: protein-disulfide reductase DsbD N-terminal domain-containing protein [Bacteroidota]MBZ4190761.1 protein-disulfide reductase DsbD N-terminal domain-containing protein [Niabella beijingensis]UMQ40847.1 protein-disulfide reductase DsbD N-terminal domain-containing protein [Chryseobacterium sp. Y16C]
MKKIIFFVAFVFLSATSFGQILKPVKWSYAAKRTSDKEAVLLLKATIENGWHIYSLSVPKDGPQPTSFSFQSSKSYQLNGKVLAAKPIVKHDPTFDMQVGYYEKSVVFQQKVKLTDQSPTVKGTLTYMVCNDKQCLPPEEVAFSIPVK